MQSEPLSQAWHQLRTRWQREFHVYESPQADCAAIRASHLQSIGRLTPVMMAGNMVGGLLLAASLHAFVPAWQLAPWLVTLLALCAAAMANWWRYQLNPPVAVSPRAVTRTIRGALALSLLWTTATVAWLPVIGRDPQLLLSTLVIGLMCGGAFALASVPQAAVAYIAVMTAGSVIGLGRSGGMVHAYLLVMVVFYGVALCLSVLINARIHTARLVSERDAEHQGELVGLLLRDFEEHSADLLWEVGHGGRFTRVSDRLATALRSSSEHLHATRLLDVLARRCPSDGPGSHIGTLTVAMAEGRPFRDIEVQLQTAGGLRWWSITAKPLTGVGGCVEGWRGVIADVTPAREAHERLAQLAHFDSLTGLANRLQLGERVHRAIARPGATADHAGRIALLCVDVDHFKSINDTLGHAVGDAVLIEVARRLRGSLRQADLAARLGGDEFALVVDLVSDEEQVHGLARRLVQALGQPLEVKGHTVPISVSVGVALAPEHGASLDELLGNADLALYAAKETGRGRYEFFAPRLGDRHRRRVQIAQELRGALTRGEFTLAWQPQVQIERWQIFGAEVLLRWQHPQLGAVSPAEFISVAEESGQIGTIGAWVLEQACVGAVGLPPSMSVSVNASPAQLLRDDFVRTVELALARSGLAPRRLEIEITESLFMEAVPVAMANLHGLRKLGVRIALDDFGTGFSSLAYLMRFPFDVLKIDRAFVLELLARDDARALVRTIVEMARALGMGTIAEGVEDAAQLEVLRQAGCESIQGYLVARPMPLAQLERLVEDWCIAAGASADMAPAEAV